MRRPCCRSCITVRSAPWVSATRAAAAAFRFADLTNGHSSVPPFTCFTRVWSERPARSSPARRPAGSASFARRIGGVGVDRTGTHAEHFLRGSRRLRQPRRRSSTGRGSASPESLSCCRFVVLPGRRILSGAFSHGDPPCSAASQRIAPRTWDARRARVWQLSPEVFSRTSLADSVGHAVCCVAHEQTAMP